MQTNAGKCACSLANLEQMYYTVADREKYGITCGG